MSKPLDKDQVIKHKKAAKNKLDGTIEAFINNPDDKYLKKADLLSYWIEDYSKYLLEEDRYDYSKIPSFKRGEIVSVNLGFNIGSEFGGLHYAIVLDNNNKKSSRVITVIPLTSGDSSKAYERDVFLGNELHEKLKSKCLSLLNDMREQVKETQEILKVVSNVESTKDTEKLKDQLQEKLNHLTQEEKTLESYAADFSKLKFGSIALVEQITTVSKMRIYKPKNKNDLLYNIKFSDRAMDLIDEKIKELFIHNK